LLLFQKLPVVVSVKIGCIGDVQDSQGVSASEMTYIVSGGALNSTHSPQAAYVCICIAYSYASCMFWT